nr:centrosomal protein of 170 kDa-like [Misgurnus anguillicaudatus]
MQANSVSKLTDTKSKTAPANNTPAANNRWRRLPPIYASTSEDEFGFNRNSPKHIRLRPGTTLRTSRLGVSAPLTTSPGGLLLKNRMREQEEYIRDWTAHSEEIAR